jgi:hypothetical protein
LGSAIYGAAQGRDGPRVTGVSGALLVYALLASEFDPAAFPSLLGAARAASKDLGGGDPLERAIGQILEAFRENFHPQTAAQLVLVVIRHLSEADRESALRVILEARPE